MKRSVTVCAMGVLVGIMSHASLCSGQPTSEASAPEAMKKLAFLIGRWEGLGTITHGPNQTHEARVTESAEFKLQGAVFILEGRGIATMPDGSEQLVHDALGIISYDKAKDRFVFRTYRAGGEMLEPEIEVSDRALVWHFQNERAGTIRFRLSVDANDVWQETGEVSQDGTNWFKFFDMKLKRVPDPSE